MWGRGVGSVCCELIQRERESVCCGIVPPDGPVSLPKAKLLGLKVYTRTHTHTRTCAQTGVANTLYSQ